MNTHDCFWYNNLASTWSKPSNFDDLLYDLDTLGDDNCMILLSDTVSCPSVIHMSRICMLDTNSPKNPLKYPKHYKPKLNLNNILQYRIVVFTNVSVRVIDKTHTLPVVNAYNSSVKQIFNALLPLLTTAEEKILNEIESFANIEEKILNEIESFANIIEGKKKIIAGETNLPNEKSKKNKSNHKQKLNFITPSKIRGPQYHLTPKFNSKRYM